MLKTVALARALLLCFLLPNGSSPTTFEHQVYVWQRQWLPEHRESIRKTEGLISGFRVLSSQLHPRTGWVFARVDLPLLAAEGRPVVAVIRLDGALADLPINQVSLQLKRTISTWLDAGVRLTGIEFDYDCPASALAGYRAALVRWRNAVPAPLTLSITALPSWLDSAALDGLLAVVDQSVLQVHAVQQPTNGLFSVEQAFAWSLRWAERSPSPFFLALPAYGVALIHGAGGVSVESETILHNNSPRDELHSDPEDVARLISKLRSHKPKHLVGLIWFRLPLETDRRAWPWQTLAAVISERSLYSQLEILLYQKGFSGDVSIRNTGNAPAALPDQVVLNANHCEAGDGVSGYRYSFDGEVATFRRSDSRTMLAAGKSVQIGWLNCKKIEQDAANDSN